MPQSNQCRFHRVDVQPTLVGEWSLIREWEHIGQQDRVVISTFPTAAEADAAIRRKRVQKERPGYFRLPPLAPSAS